MNKFKDDYGNTMALQVVNSRASPREHSHIIADDLEREFRNQQQSRGEQTAEQTTAKFVVSEYNENIQSQHQHDGYEEGNVLSAKTVDSNSHLNEQMI